MEARVKATGEIVEVISRWVTLISGDTEFKYIDQKTGVSYFKDELCFPKDLTDDPDYWTRLEHQYAGMAMQGLLASGDWGDCSWYIIAEDAITAAHILIQKLKEKKE